MIQGQVGDVGTCKRQESQCCDAEHLKRRRPRAEQIVVKPFDHRRGVAVTSRELGRKRRAQCRQLGLGLRRCGVRPEPTHGEHQSIVLPRWIDHRIQRCPGCRRVEYKPEVGRHDANDRVGPSAQRNRLSQHGGIAIETALPDRMGQKDEGRVLTLLSLREQPAD